MQVGQCSRRAYGNMDSLIDSMRSLRGELKAEKVETQKATNEVQRLKKSVADGLAERERLLTKLKDLKEERIRLLGEKA